MRRLSLSLFVLALAGMLIAACDPRTEREADISDAESAEECSDSTPTITSLDTLAEEATIAALATATASPILESGASPTRVSTAPPTEPEEATGGPVIVSPVESPSATGDGAVTPAMPSPTCEPSRALEELTPTPEPVTYTTGEGLILFMREGIARENGPPLQELWRADIDGSNQVEIALPNGCGGIHTFDLSPAGGHVAFLCAGEPPATSLFVLALQDGTYNLISSTAAYGNAYWSPDGALLAYMDAREPGPYNVHTVAADVSDDRDWGDAPSASLGGWTPDGRVIFPDGFCPIAAGCFTASVLMALDTGERVYLPDVSEVGPFSPDGRAVLGTVRLPRTPANPSTNYPNPDFAVALIDLMNGGREQVGFVDRNARPARWIDEQTFLVTAVKRGNNPYGPIDCQEWAVSVSDVSQPTLASQDCWEGYLSRDGRYAHFGRIRDLGGSPRVGDLYRLALSDGSEALWMADALTTEIYEPAP